MKNLGSDLIFAVPFTYQGVSASGLTVEVDVYLHDGSGVVIGQAANDVGIGVYSYTLPGSYVNQPGKYCARFRTTSSVDNPHAFDFQEVIV